MEVDALIGKRIGGYLIHEQIGRGGMSMVYRARQESVNRDIALKVIDFREVHELDNFGERFANEAAIIASLEHIHILPVHDYGIEGDYAYLAMRLLLGGSVRDLTHTGPMPMEQIVPLFLQIASGLAYAHSMGIVHRDVKPANILLDSHGNAYLTDFGLAKMIGRDKDMTKHGAVMGTLNYISPEQLRGERIDHRADIYSLGVTLYHMTCGRTPFNTGEEDDVVAIIYKHIAEPPILPRQINPEIPPLLEKVILKALEKQPENRYASVGEMAKELQLATGITPSAQFFPPVSPRLQQENQTTSSAVPVNIHTITTTTVPKFEQRKKTRWLIAALICIVLVTVAVMALLITSQKAEIPAFTIKIGKSLNSSEIVPTADQIKLAQQHLGDDGFIALITCNLSSEFHITRVREMIEFAREYGLRTEIYDGDNDGPTQRLKLEAALIDNASAFILCALDYDLLDEPLQAIEDAGLPLVHLAAPPPEFGGISVITDNYEMGLEVGRFAGLVANTTFTDNVQAVILDYPSLTEIVQRAQGLADGLMEIAPKSQIIVNVEGAIRANAYQSVKKLLDEGVSFNMILSINDAGSYGAIDALVEAGLTPDDVAIMSVDAEREAMQYIRDGYYIQGSLSVGRREGARAAVDIIVQMLSGETIPETVIIPPGEVITREMLAQTETPQP